MVERQDIDALLIGALYGELTPAEEQQLTAHLETHPADRTALEGLTQVRQTLHESRILQVQLDPPQSVSALLLQEAARRAPKVKTAPAEGDGWFARFVRSFVQHPAMAAAAMLVLVVGFAAMVGRNKGSIGHDTTVSTAPAAQTTEVAEGSAVATPTERDFIAPSAEPPPAPMGGEGAAAPADPAAAAPSLDDRGGARGAVGTGAAQDDRDSYKVDLAQNAFEKQNRAAPAKDAAADGLIVERKPLAPREYEAAPKPASAKKAKGSVLADEALEESAVRKEAPREQLAYGASSGGAPGSPPPAPPPPPPAATTAPAPATAELAKAPDGKLSAADDKKAEAKAESADPNAAWARTQHTSLVAAVNANDCTRAANIALAIEQRAPAYFTANVATDRSTKNCQPTIAAVREKNEAEMVARKRALAEPSKASATKKPATKKAAPKSTTTESK